MKILVIMQYWEEDQKQAEEVIKLACDLLPEMSELVELLFVYRYDAKPPSTAVQIAAQQKFGKVGAWRCTRNGEGWPGGPNEMAYGVLSHVPIQRHLHNAFPDIDAILLLEADMVFTRPDWDKVLVEEWGKTVLDNKLICGALVAKDAPDEHINGGAMFAWDATTHITALRGGPYLEAWDFHHRRIMVQNARPSRQFYLDYKRGTITPEELFFERESIVPVIYHGVKDRSAIQAVRDKYFPKAAPITVPVVVADKPAEPIVAKQSEPEPTPEPIAEIKENIPLEVPNEIKSDDPETPAIIAAHLADNAEPVVTEKAMAAAGLINPANDPVNPANQ